MTTLLHVVRAEWLKLRRTLALGLVVLAPLSVVLLFLALVGVDAVSPAQAGWHTLSRSAVDLWALFMLPLFVALETALLNDVDHREDAWKRLYTLPAPRWAVCAARLLVALFLVGIGSLLLSAGLPLAFLLLQALPGTQLPAADVSWQEVVQGVGFAYLGAWFILALQHWISMRWASLTLALGVAVAATVGVVGIEGSPWWFVYPWALPLAAGDPERQVLAVTVSLAGFLLVALFAGWEATRHDVY